jgi:crotonobetainyl-CoA:carnitine CoA-transferase CaiB-like acyl-CoA transferase
MGDPEWARDPSMSTVQGRCAAHDHLDTELAAWCRGRQSDDIVDTVWRAGVPVGRVLLPHEQDGLPPIQARRFFETVDHPVTRRTLYGGYPVRFSAGPETMNCRHPPLLGEHNHEILSELLGFSDAEIHALEAADIIGNRVTT